MLRFSLFALSLAALHFPAVGFDLARPIRDGEVSSASCSSKLIVRYDRLDIFAVNLGDHWTFSPLHTRIPVTRYSSSGSFIENHSFDQTWGPVKNPPHSYIEIGFFTRFGNTGEPIRFYLVTGIDPSAEGTLIWSYDGNGGSNEWIFRTFYIGDKVKNGHFFFIRVVSPTNDYSVHGLYFAAQHVNTQNLDDYDLDGIPNLHEELRGTDPTLPDTDGDTWADGIEVERRTSPTDPSSLPGPRIVASATLTGQSGYYETNSVGDVVIVRGGEKVLMIDLSDFDKTGEISSITQYRGGCFGLTQIWGNSIFTSCGDYLTKIDITDLYHPVPGPLHDTHLSGTFGITVIGGYAFCVIGNDNQFGYRVYDVRGEGFEEIGHEVIPRYEGRDADITIGDHTYITHNDGSLRIIDANDPYHPKQIHYGRFLPEGMEFSGVFKQLFPSDNRVFGVAHELGFYSIDVTDPVKPRTSGPFVIFGQSYRDSFIVGSDLIVRDAREGILIFDASNPDYPVVKRKYSLIPSLDHSTDLYYDDGKIFLVHEFYNNYYAFVILTGYSPDDTIPPRVLDISPDHGASNVDRDTWIGVTFSEGIDRHSVDSNSVSLWNGDFQVPILVGVVNPFKHVVNVKPLETLVEDTTYTVRVGENVTDLSGNLLCERFEAGFSTGLYDVGEGVDFPQTCDREPLLTPTPVYLNVTDLIEVEEGNGRDENVELDILELGLVWSGVSVP